MSQLNLNLTPEFEDKLRRFMRVRGLKTKSEALRVALEDSLARSTIEWSQLRGSGLSECVPRFSNDDELWEKG